MLNDSLLTKEDIENEIAALEWADDGAHNEFRSRWYTAGEVQRQNKRVADRLHELYKLLEEYEGE